MKFTIVEVENNKQLRKFIKFPNVLYKNNQYYIPQLFINEFFTLDRKKNPSFKFCEARYWLAVNENKDVIGRIAGIVNNRYNEFTGTKYIRFGWFDVIDDLQVAKALIEKVIQWGQNEKMEFIHGPLGFQEFDPSGILIEGFDQLPTIYGKYNYPYYSKFLETLNFEKEVDWVEYRITIPNSLPERISKMIDTIKQRNQVHAVNLKSKKHLLFYADQIFDLLNREYTKVHGFYPLTKEQIEYLKKQFFPLIQLFLVSVIVNEQDNVVGFGLCMPSLSEAFQKTKGRLFPFNWIHILKSLKRNTVVDTLLLAVDTTYQDKGIPALIFYQIGQYLIKNGYQYIESTRQLEDNFSILNLWNKLEYKIHKRARCYRKKL